MKSNTLTPRDLFGNQVRYTVPLFQRPYVWNKEKQWEPLWDDVRTVAERILENKEAQAGETRPTEAVPHFLGAIVLDQMMVRTGFIQERHIIDGQQRLTTLQLLLDAAQLVIQEYGAQPDAAALQSLVLNDPDMASTPDQVFKVWPTNYDRAAFAAAMDDSVTVTGELRKTRIVKAHTFFVSEVEEWADIKGDPDKAKYRLNALGLALREYLRLVVIDLEPGDNAQVIFETLNYRGAPLLAADLIKNSVFKQAEAEGLDVELIYETSWKRFDSDHWRAEIKQGRLKRPRIDSFLNYWLVMRKTHEVPADRIFTDFSDFATYSDWSLSQVLQDMNHHADVYEELDRFHWTSTAGTFAYRILDVMDQGVWVPVLLWLFGQPRSLLPVEQLDRALSAIESWSVRRMVCRLTTKGINRFGVDLLKHLDTVEVGEAGDAVSQFLASREGDSARWPEDQEVIAACISEPMYRRITRARLRMILEALEDDLRTPLSEEDHCVRGSLTIEHVMPQGWREHWPLPGTDAPGVEELKRDQLIHTLGNLTLVNNKLNPSLSNRPWTDEEARARGLGERGKRSILHEHSVLALNSDIENQWHDGWNESVIAERSLDLASRITRIWPGPAAERWDQDSSLDGAEESGGFREEE